MHYRLNKSVNGVHPIYPPLILRLFAISRIHFAILRIQTARHIPLAWRHRDRRSRQTWENEDFHFTYDR